MITGQKRVETKSKFQCTLLKHDNTITYSTRIAVAHIT